MDRKDITNAITSALGSTIDGMAASGSGSGSDSGSGGGGTLLLIPELIEIIASYASPFVLSSKIVYHNESDGGCRAALVINDSAPPPAPAPAPAVILGVGIQFWRFILQTGMCGCLSVAAVLCCWACFSLLRIVRAH